MIKDFMSVTVTPEQRGEYRWKQLWPGPNGFKLDISAPRIREGLDRWRKEKGIPLRDPLSPEERIAFEKWYLANN